MVYSKITATGSYLPEQILTNKDLEKMVDTSNEWIIERTGIKERRIARIDEKTSDMAYHAAIDAINSSNFDKSTIDLIIVATSTADMIFPSTACILQHKLGLTNIPAFDLQAACTGFMYALTTADCYIKSGLAKNILIVGVDTVSRALDYTDRNTCILFGDGAGAVIVSLSNTPGILANELHADGSGVDILNATGYIGYGKLEGHPYIKMDGKAVFKMAVRNMTDMAKSILEKASVKKEDLDWFIPHQANLRIIESTAEFLGITLDKVIITVDKHGNTSAASVPLAFDYAVKSGKIKPGQLVLLEGVGAGFTWGASVLRY